MDRDRQLVERTLGGDMGAFEELVQRHREVVYRVAARVVGAENADDVSQDAFLRAFHRLERFRGESAFRSWLLQITHNAALTALARRREEPVGVASEVEAQASTGRERTPAERLEESERRERLELKLRELRPEHRTVLVLRDIEGLSYDEIADASEAPLGTVKGRLHRARSELIEVLRRNLYDWELPDDG